MQTATREPMMTAQEYVAYARKENAIREARGEAQAFEHYGLVRIGRNGNDPTAYGVMNEQGIIWVIGQDGKTRNWETGELCPDQLTIDPINKRLEAMGETFRVSTKHRAVRRTLFMDLPEQVA